MIVSALMMMICLLACLLDVILLTSLGSLLLALLLWVELFGGRRIEVEFPPSMDVVVVIRVFMFLLLPSKTPFVEELMLLLSTRMPP